MVTLTRQERMKYTDKHEASFRFLDATHAIGFQTGKRYALENPNPSNYKELDIMLFAPDDFIEAFCAGMNAYMGMRYKRDLG